MEQNLTYIDLFCGAGGFSLGFEKMGFENLFSLDIEPSFCNTYKANFPSHTLIEKDIFNLANDEIRYILDGKDVDVVIGGPPCQGFSIAGNIGRKFVDDPRNHLFKEFARVVSIVKPKYFVMENVARLYTHNKGETRDEIISVFKELGYQVQCQILNSADFGVPQIRKRVIFIGSRLSDYIKFPEKSINKYKTVKDAIDDFPKLESGQLSDIQNHVAMKHSEQMLTKMSFVNDGGDRYQIPEKLRPLTGDVRKYIRYNSSQPAICITGDMRKVFHYSQNRALTVRELAKLQSFPNDFVFTGSTISQQQQVGNSVPPLMAQAIANTILKIKKHDESIS
ncbi:modification methylase [Flavobacterium rivuli WB 3.3-2 = DSM 21788]|uniref:Cytosine-specific methyltransferase n=1 Tax=Flavobacterium rivuli WB 3.3-2 = DSM 21788 TaxID=1121895 RepID=A0A0A2MCG7_9FLAO|nr:DNA (cytosine-5-)-methyltransferase [Flavobacterium rivuli]KGO85980.1 modification methylase [Flavobacterium rivuli WB 3.3-2 = DSM 21788]